MPIALSPTRPKNGLTKVTNCRLLKGNELIRDDLWFSSVTGKIIHSQASFYDELVLPDETVDLGGRIVAPGMIDVQLNGAFGFNFSTLLDDMSQYGKKVKETNRLMIQTGVTSYLPTITSQKPELYQSVSRDSTSTISWQCGNVL
jgi:N-acetylglucosamine-6-phosphate deacetylase